MTMRIDANTFSTMNLVADADHERLRHALDDEGFAVFTIDGTDVHDAESFFAAAIAGLPTPPDARADDFTVLRDHLRVGLDALESGDVAFVWRHADAMLEHGLPTLLDAVDTFVSLSRQVYSPARTNFSHKIRLLTFLSGSGPNFAPIGSEDRPA